MNTSSHGIALVDHHLTGATGRHGGNWSLSDEYSESQQFDVGLIAVTTILLFPGHFGHDAEFFKNRHGRIPF